MIPTLFSSMTRPDYHPETTLPVAPEPLPPLPQGNLATPSSSTSGQSTMTKMKQRLVAPSLLYKRLSKGDNAIPKDQQPEQKQITLPSSGFVVRRRMRHQQLQLRFSLGTDSDEATRAHIDNLREAQKSRTPKNTVVELDCAYDDDDDLSMNHDGVYYRCVSHNSLHPQEQQQQEQRRTQPRKQVVPALQRSSRDKPQEKPKNRMDKSTKPEVVVEEADEEEDWPDFATTTTTTCTTQASEQEQTEKVKSTSTREELQLFSFEGFNPVNHHLDDNNDEDTVGNVHSLTDFDDSFNMINEEDDASCCASFPDELTCVSTDSSAASKEDEEGEDEEVMSVFVSLVFGDDTEQEQDEEAAPAGAEPQQESEPQVQEEEEEDVKEAKEEEVQEAKEEEVQEAKDEEVQDAKDEDGQEAKDEDGQEAKKVQFASEEQVDQVSGSETVEKSSLTSSSVSSPSPPGFILSNGTVATNTQGLLPFGRNTKPITFAERMAKLPNLNYRRQLDKERRELELRKRRMSELSMRKKCGVMFEEGAMNRDPYSVGCAVPSATTLQKILAQQSSEDDDGTVTTATTVATAICDRSRSYNIRIEQRMNR